MSFKVISIPLCQNAIAIPLSFMPLSFIDVLIRIYHSALTLRLSVDPVPIVSVPVLVEESASAVFSVLKPIACVFPSQLPTFISPVSSLSMSSITMPHAFELVSILVELDAETILAIILPVANVPGRLLPLLSLDATVLLPLLLLYTDRNC